MVIKVIDVGRVSLYPYGLMIGLGVWLGAEMATRIARRHHVAETQIWNWVWVMGLGGIIGARIYHIVDQWAYYQADLSRVIRLWEGGLGIFGGMVGGFLALLIYFWRQNEGKNWKGLGGALDIAGLVMPLSQAIGRIGNFINQEVYGLPTNLPWGIRIEGSMQKYHPLFLYELVLNLGLWWWLNKWERSNRWSWGKGYYAALYLIGYGAIRFCLEFLRIESFWGGGVRVAQLFGLGAMIIGGVRLGINKKQK